MSGSPRDARARAWVAGLRPPDYVLVTLGLCLVLVPTLYAMVPRWGHTKGLVRPVTFGAWCLVALLAGTFSALRDERVHELLSGRATMEARLAVKARRDVLQALLARGTKGIPRHYEFTVYVYNADRDVLEPVYPPLIPPQDPDPREFKPGKGATGLAWQEWRTRGVPYVRGDDVSNEQYHLTPAQQTFFAGFRSVASAIALDLEGVPLGVLTALSPQDDGYFGKPEHRDALASLGETLGVVLAAIPDSD
jgi:hypothetical protein